MNNSCSDEFKILIRSSSASEFSLMNKNISNNIRNNNNKRSIDVHNFDYDNVNNSSNNMSVNHGRKK